jgi:hypothetical protein
MTDVPVSHRHAAERPDGAVNPPSDLLRTMAVGIILTQ